MADWLWQEWWRAAGRTLEVTRSSVAASVSQREAPQTFVLLVDDEPVGTASLVARLRRAPDLTPWLAGAFIVPEAVAKATSSVWSERWKLPAALWAPGAIWLYTAGAERIYARAEPHTVEVI